MKTKVCPECGGTGEIPVHPLSTHDTLVCSDCDGTGEIEVEHESDEEDE